MRELLLLRHAKSSWDSPGLDDRDRPLNDRGRRAAQAMGRVIADRRLSPDLALCSPARRARDTWSILVEELDTPPAVQIEETLYDFGDGSSLLRLMHSLPAEARRIVLIGHNPSLENLALRLTGPGDGKLIKRLKRKFPTAALAVLRFDAAGWPDIADGQGRLVDFIRPRDVIPEDTGED